MVVAVARMVTSINIVKGAIKAVAVVIIKLFMPEPASWLVSLTRSG